MSSCGFQRELTRYHKPAERWVEFRLFRMFYGVSRLGFQLYPFGADRRLLSPPLVRGCFLLDLLAEELV